MINRGILTETTRPMQSPMNLDVGRINPREALHIGGLSILSLFVSTLGGMIAWWAKEGSFAFLYFGTGVAIVGLGTAITLLNLTYKDWTEYRQRLNDWNALFMDSYENQGGIENVRTIEVDSLNPNEPLHMLGLALSIQARIAKNDDNAYAIRSLVGPVLIGDGKNAISLGRVPTKFEAEKLSSRLVDLGLIVNRKEGTSGDWAAKDVPSVITTIYKNWHKIAIK